MELNEKQNTSDFLKVFDTLMEIEELKNVKLEITLEEAGVSSIAFLKAMIKASKILETPFSELNPEELSVKKTLKQNILYLIKKL